MRETLLWRWLTGDGGADMLSLSWLHPVPAWVWVLMALGVSLFAGWSYSRLAGSLWLRCVMAVLRVLGLMWLIVLLSGPMLVQTRERVEPDRLIWLVDRSGSMNVRDEAQSTRDEQVKEQVSQLATEIEQKPDIWSHERNQYWYGFDDQAYAVNPQKLADTSGGAGGTQIATALETVLDQHQGHPISAVVLISDGRTPQRVGAELLRKLQQSAVSVFSVPVGLERSYTDIAIAQVDAPQQAYANDVVPVRVQLSLLPDDQTIEPSRVKVQLIDTQTGAVLDEVTAKDGKLTEPVQLNVKSQQVGSRDWLVKVVYDPPSGPSSHPGAELNEENNQQLVTVNLIDEPIRVLYIDGYPRWEYRYLKSALMREKSIKSSMFLISADQQFAQEGDVPIARLPQTAQEFEAYDVIIIGDVPSRHFSTEQLSMIRDHVAQRGAGLIWIGGARWTPVTYDTTVLANLLPMRQVSAVSALGNQPVNVVPTALAKSLQVLELEPGKVTDKQTVAQLTTPLRWVQQLGELKPVAEVLAEAQFVNGNETNLPLITSLRYGAGQVLYVASDDFWRWRYAKGDLYYQPFWTQLVRLLGRGRVAQTDQSTTLSTAHRRLLLKQNTVVKLTTRDALLLEQNRQSIRVLVESIKDGQVVDQMDLLPQQTTESAGSSSDKVYQVIWQPRHTGRLRLYPADASLASSGSVQSFIQVQHPDDEMRQPQPDHALLTHLAQQTGGQVVALDEMEKLANILPNRARRTPDDIRYPLWHDLWVYLFFVTFITVEWILRKVCKLV